MGIKAASEQDIVNDCLQYLTAIRRWLCWRNNTTGLWRQDGTGRKFWAAPGKKGISDLLGLLPEGRKPEDDPAAFPARLQPGRFLAVEVKTATGKLTPHQQQFLDDVRARGGLSLCVRSVQDLIDQLTREGY